MRVIKNGVLVPIEESDCNDKGWMSGNGVFETIKTVDNKPWALSRHMRRAVASSQQIGFRIPSEDVVRSSVEELCLNEQYPVGLLRLSFGHNGNWCAVHLPYEATNHAAKLLTYDQVIAVEGQQYNTPRVRVLYGPQARSAKLALIASSRMGPTHVFPGFLGRGNGHQIRESLFCAWES